MIKIMIIIIIIMQIYSNIKDNKNTNIYLWDLIYPGFLQ